MNFDEWFFDLVKVSPDWSDAAGNYETIAAEAWEYQEQLAELQAQKTRSQEHYIKLLRDKDERIAELERALHNITNMAHPQHMDIFNEAMKGLGIQEAGE